LDWQHFPTALERVLTRCNLRVNLESCLGKCLAAAPERLLASAGSLTFTRANFGESFGQVKYLASMRRWERNACVAGNCRWANAAAPAGTMALGRAIPGKAATYTHTRLIYKSNRCPHKAAISGGKQLELADYLLLNLPQNFNYSLAKQT